jgi:hypothetical protein
MDCFNFGHGRSNFLERPRPLKRATFRQGWVVLLREYWVIVFGYFVGLPKQVNNKFPFDFLWSSKYRGSETADR